MKMAFAGTALLLLTACGGAATGVSRGVSGIVDPAIHGIPSMARNPVEDASFGTIINGIRTDRGVLSVTYDARLDAAAQAHAEDMLARGYVSHTTPEGLTEFDRISAQGYNAVNFGENIARGQSTEAEALAGWIESAEHNRLLGAGTVDDFGLGVAGTGSSTHWVLVMARER